MAGLGGNSVAPPQRMAPISPVRPANRPPIYGQALPPSPLPDTGNTTRRVFDTGSGKEIKPGDAPAPASWSAATALPYRPKAGGPAGPMIQAPMSDLAAAMQRMRSGGRL